ncbi:MAG: hypothetical protein ACTHU0_28815, partial [Kofleriaceae bacterium]
MSDDLHENVYRLIESAIDLLDYVVPTNAKVYVGTYRELSHEEEEIPAKVWDWQQGKAVQPPSKKVTRPGRWVTLQGDTKRRLFKYILEYESRPVPQADFDLVGTGDDQRHVTRIPRNAWSPSGTSRFVYLHTVPRYADLIYDNLAELRACDFPWANAVAGLSREFRRDLFERNLHEQKEMPQVPTNGRTWLKQLADYCTYDSDGSYYNKWKAGEPGPNRIHSEKYKEVITARRQEVVLQKGLIYMLVASKDSPSVLYSIELDGDQLATKLTAHRMQSGLLWTLPSFKQNTTREFDIYVISTPVGAKQESKSARKSLYHLKDGDQASNEVVDPRKLVAAALGDEQMQHLGIAEGDEWAWFTQLVAHVFPEPYYALDANAAKNHAWVRQFGLERLREETSKFMEKAWKAQGPEEGKPITAAARRLVREKMKNINTVVIPQGFPSGKNTRFIGTDGYYAFDRDIENGFIYVLPNVEYLGSLAQGRFAADLYDDLKWLVPMMEAAAYIAAVAVGGGFAMSARKFVVKQTTKRVARQVIKEAIRSVEPALISMLLDVVLELVTKPVMRIYATLDANDG